MPKILVRWFFRLWLGKRTYEYMQATLWHDERLPKGDSDVDIVVRQDGRESRVEADWLKNWPGRYLTYDSSYTHA